MLIAAFSLSTEEGTAIDGPTGVIIEMDDPIIPDPVLPESKPPSVLAETLKNLQPEVTTDSMETLTPPPITDEILETAQNGDINDTVRFVETYDL